MTNIFFPTTFYKQIWARKKHVLEYPKLDFVGIFLLWDVVEMLSNSMFLLPPKRTPNVQNPYVCQTLSNLVVDLVHVHIHIHPMQICFFFQHPPSHLYPKYIQIWFHIVLFLFVHFVCFPYLFCWPPTFITGGLRRCRPKQTPRCDVMPSLWHGSERIPRRKLRCGKGTLQFAMGDTSRMIFPVDEMNHN